MSIFNQLIILSKKIAASLLKDEELADLDESQIFSDEDKEYIIKNITDESSIIDRLNLANRINKAEDWRVVKSKINIPVIKLWHWKYAVAASLVLLFSITFIFNKKETTQINTPVIVNNKIEKGTDKATLTLEDDSTVILEKGSTYQAKNVNSNGEQIIYQPTTGNRQLTTNTLTIPRGGQFQLTLSDDTRVWLNSETQLKYPVSFIDGKSRQVELVYGEAYFEVSPSTAHNGANFKVYNNKQEVEVLGTQFNIRAYKDETNIYTTLAEGKVAVNFENQNKILKPGEQSNVHINTKNMQVVEVDVFREVAWKQGIFSFKNKPLKEIMASLSRWYDMDVVFQNKALENVTFNGNLNKNQSIEEILTFIKGSINTYEINNKTIILK